MTRNQYLILAAIAGLFFLVVVVGVALIALPWIADRQVQPLPTVTDPVVVFPTGTPIALITPTEAPTQLPTDPAPTSVPTDVPPTAEPTSTVPPPPTSTPLPTPVPVPCDWAGFISDVTVKDGTDFVPGAGFTKTWRLKNIGSCTWNSDYDLVFSSGSAMGAATSIALPKTVKPGETIDISVAMKAPDKEGAYTGYWLLRNPAGATFGLGDARNKAVWVSIDVILPCYWVGFVADVTVPDDTSFTAGISFVKTWRLKNIGKCDWTTGFDAVYASGDKLGATVADMPKTVKPGETVDLSVTFTAPAQTGDYRGYWLLKTSDGKLFGMGAAQDKGFWVDIKVTPAKSGYAFDFAANYCSAVWKSEKGTLPCPGKADDANGFVVRLNNPKLENRQENEPALWTGPNKHVDGWISGKFPAIVIEDGDRFKAWVGCLDGAEDCEVTFYLRYQVDGGEVKTLGTWDEVYDGQVTEIDIDLSSLAGKSVSFILIAEVDGGDPAEAEAFWFAPRIVR